MWKSNNPVTRVLTHSTVSVDGVSQKTQAKPQKQENLDNVNPTLFTTNKEGTNVCDMLSPWLGSSLHRWSLERWMNAHAINSPIFIQQNSAKHLVNLQWKSDSKTSTEISKIKLQIFSHAKSHRNPSIRSKNHWKCKSIQINQEMHRSCISFHQTSCNQCARYYHDIGKLQITDISTKFCTAAVVCHDQASQPENVLPLPLLLL